MNMVLRNALTSNETDIDGALRRFSGDERLYVACLREFLLDQTIIDLDSSLEAKTWDDAFTAAHALKGLAGNMGFIPLFHSAAELVVQIRTGSLDLIDSTYCEVKRNYKEIYAAISGFIDAGDRSKEDLS